MQERGLEREYLERLLQDQQANRNVIARLNRQQASQVEHAHRIYPLVSRGDWDGLDTTSAVVASYQASPTPTPTWVDDTFEELKSAGRIGLIRNAQVRSGLLEYYGYLESADYTYELMSTQYRDAIRERMDPDLQLEIRRACGRATLGEVRDCRLDVTTWNLATYADWLSSNPELAKGLRRVIVQWTRAEEEYLPGVAERTEAMIVRLQQELAR